MKMLITLEPHGIFLIKICILLHFNIVWAHVCKTFSDLYILELFGMYILAEALHNFISVHAASTLKFKHMSMLEAP